MTNSKVNPIYVASRASIPERGAMWRKFRDEGVLITSSWIDEDGEGQTGDFGELWLRIANEIRAASALVLYAKASDFPLKGALTEAGIALGMNKPVIICLPDLGVLPRNYRPIGSWIAHPLVTRRDDIRAAIHLATNTRLRADNAAPVVDQWLQEIESTCNSALLDVYDQSIANAPISPEYARGTADCVAYRVGQIREAIAAIRAAASPAAPQGEADKQQAAIALLDEWLKRPAVEDDPFGDELRRLIDENRLSNRKFWPELTTKPSGEATQRAAKELKQAGFLWSNLAALELGAEPFSDEEQIEQVAAIISRHFAAAPVGESWLPLSRVIEIVEATRNSSLWNSSGYPQALTDTIGKLRHAAQSKGEGE